MEKKAAAKAKADKKAAEEKKAAAEKVQPHSSPPQRP